MSASLKIENYRKSFVDWEIYEYVDYYLLNQLLTSKQIQEKDLKILNKFKKKLDNNLIRINFVNSTSYGRVYAENNIAYHGMSKKLRNTLVKDLYYDFDIKNATPSILLSVLEKSDIPESYYTNLKDYVLHRDSYLEIWDSKIDWKNEIIKIFFGGNNPRILYPKEVIDLKNELFILSKKLKELNPHIRVKKEFNELGSFLSHYIFNIESLIIDAVLSFIKDKHPETITYQNKTVFAYEFDGIKLLKNNIQDVDKFLKSINEYIQEIYKYVEFVNKPYTIYYEEFQKRPIEEKENDDFSVLDDTQLSLLTELSQSIGLSDREIVDLLKKVYDDRILFDEDKNTWYYFDTEKSKWITSSSKKCQLLKCSFYDHIYQYFCIELKEDFKRMYQFVYDNYQPKSPVIEMMNKLQTVLDILSDSHRLNNVCDYLTSYCIRRFKDKKFKFDDNDFIVGFENGIFDLNTFEFRKGHFEDFCSMSVGYQYEPIRDIEKEDEILNILKKIHPNEENLKLWLMMYASMLCGLNIEKFFMLLGNGRNGKGMINEFMAHTLGDYIYYCEPCILIKEIDSSTANPALAHLDKKRGVIVKEPHEDKKLNNSNVKTLTGGGYLNARFLYQNACQVKQRFTLVLESNELPLLLCTPKTAEIERFIVLKHNSTFLNVENEDIENNIYKQDIRLKTNEWKNEYRMSFFHILVDYYKLLLSQKFQFQQTIFTRQASMDYLKNCDPIYEIIMTYFELGGNYTMELKEVVKHVKNLAQKDKAFYTIRQIRKISKERIVESLHQLKIEFVKDNVKGIKIKEEYNDDIVFENF